MELLTVVIHILLVGSNWNTKNIASAMAVTSTVASNMETIKSMKNNTINNNDNNKTSKENVATINKSINVQIQRENNSTRIFNNANDHNATTTNTNGPIPAVNNVYRFRLNDKLNRNNNGILISNNHIERNENRSNIVKTSSAVNRFAIGNSKFRITKTSPKTATTTTTNGDDKNWLLTKAWLIDNINLLRKELSKLERDYSHHLDMEQRNMNGAYNQKELVEDIAKLRADHLFLSQQQKQIILLIKKSNYARSKSNELRMKMADAPTINTKKAIKRDLSTSQNSLLLNNNNNNNNEKFQSETRQNIKEIFAELSSLHDVSLLLFDDLKTLERKMEIRDKILSN